MDVYKTNGSASDKKVTLPSEVFEIEPNEHIVWLAVTAEMTNARQGNAQVKTRSQVRGGGRKPWAQKGRGVARAALHPLRLTLPTKRLNHLFDEL